MDVPVRTYNSLVDIMKNKQFIVTDIILVTLLRKVWSNHDAMQKKPRTFDG